MAEGLIAMNGAKTQRVPGRSANPNDRDIIKRRINNKSLHFDDASSSDDDVADVTDDSPHSNSRSREKLKKMSIAPPHNGQELNLKQKMINLDAIPKVYTPKI
jgi:hypothetical protein